MFSKILKIYPPHPSNDYMHNFYPLVSVWQELTRVSI